MSLPSFPEKMPSRRASGVAFSESVPLLPDVKRASAPGDDAQSQASMDRRKSRRLSASKVDLDDLAKMRALGQFSFEFEKQGANAADYRKEGDHSLNTEAALAARTQEAAVASIRALPY